MKIKHIETHVCHARMSRAIAGIDIALWDILGKFLRRPMPQTWAFHRDDSIGDW
jgi:L-alanine-DL-glutamate epimerase-like enolase superfamily enzyme